MSYEKMYKININGAIVVGYMYGCNNQCMG